jgi:hypothetical protein
MGLWKEDNTACLPLAFNSVCVNNVNIDSIYITHLQSPLVRQISLWIRYRMWNNQTRLHMILLPLIVSFFCSFVNRVECFLLSMITFFTLLYICLHEEFNISTSVWTHRTPIPSESLILRFCKGFITSFFFLYWSLFLLFIY